MTDQHYTPDLEADGALFVYDIGTGEVVASYEGLKWHRIWQQAERVKEERDDLKATLVQMHEKPDYYALREVHYTYNVPIAALARIIGLTRAAVSDRFRRNGWPVRRHTQRTKVERLAERIHLLRTKYCVPYNLAAQVIGVSEATMSSAMTSMGYDGRVQLRHVPQPRQKLIREAYGKGMTQMDIAELTGLSQSLISDIIRGEGGYS